MSKSSSPKTYIKEDRPIRFISDINKSIVTDNIILKKESPVSPEFGVSAISYNLKKAQFIENSMSKFKIPPEIFELNKENFRQKFDEIQNSGYDYRYIAKSIEYAMMIRPKQMKVYGQLLWNISKIIEYVPSSNLKIEVQKTLNDLGLCERNIAGDIYELGKIVEKTIIDDNVEEFIKLEKRPDFDPKGKIDFYLFKAIVHIKEDFHSHYFYTYMQIMAFYGSIKCFKYALMNGSYDEQNVSMFAIAGGNKEIIHLLEQKGVSFDDCFEVSIKYHRNDISDWLLRNYKCELFQLSRTLKYFNIRAFFFLLINNYFDSREELGDSLRVCAQKCDLNVAKLLVNVFKVDVNYENKNNHTALLSAAPRGYLDMVKFLIDNGANVNKITSFGSSILAYAVRDNRYYIVKLLIEHGAIINVKSGSNKTSPLHIAAQRLYYKIAKLLIENGANVNQQDEYGNTALHYCSSCLPFYKLLVKNGANINIRNDHGRTPLQR